MATKTKTPQNDGVPPENDQPRKWCDLPKDLLIQIVEKLVFSLETDLPQMRSVCSHWRSSLPLNEVRNIDFPIEPPPLVPNTPLLLLQTRFQLLSPLSPEPGPLGGKWIARMSPLGSNKWRLFNPLNIRKYFITDPPVVGSINLLDTHVLELCRTFSLVDANKTKVKPISKKVVGGWNIDSDCLIGVLAVLERERGDELWLWRLRDDKWIEIEGTSSDDDHQIVDIVYHDEKFYAFKLWSWKIGVIDPKRESVTMEFIAAPNIPADLFSEYYMLELDDQWYYFEEAYFVPSNGQLYLVIEMSDDDGDDYYYDDDDDDDHEVIVFVMKQQREEGESDVWKRVKNIGDQIFFIGYDTCFALPSSSVNLPQWEPSSICLFTRPFPLSFDGFIAGFDASQSVPKGLECLKMLRYAKYWRYYRLFKMREEEEEDDEEEESIVRFEELPMDVYTGVFFPPPAWVEWRCPKLDNVEISFKNVKFSDADRR